MPRIYVFLEDDNPPSFKENKNLKLTNQTRTKMQSKGGPY